MGFFCLIFGKFCLNLYYTKCDDCNTVEDPFTIRNILRSGFRPSSPVTFSYLVRQEVLHFWDELRKHAPGTSESAFLEVLNTLTVFHGRVSHISRAAKCPPPKKIKENLRLNFRNFWKGRGKSFPIFLGWKRRGENILEILQCEFQISVYIEIKQNSEIR